MPYSAYTGLPGTGKSYGVFKNVIIPALKSGREVWTNIPFHEDRVLERFSTKPVLFDTKDIIDNPKWFDEVFKQGSIIVIDELWRLWPSGLKTNNILESHKSFLAEHRHRVGDNGFSTEIVICCQDLSQIAAFARNLIDTTYRSVKLDTVGMAKKYRIDIYEGPVTGPSPPVAKRINQDFGSYVPAVYDLYVSHTMSATGQAGNEKKVDGRANILKSGRIMFLPFAVIGAIAFIFVFLFSFNSFFSGASSNEVKTKAKTTKVTTVSPVTTNKLVKAKPAVLDVLDNRQLSIVFNRGHYPNIDYSIKAEDSDDYFTLSKSEMLKLGYKLRPINSCLLSVTVNTIEYIVTCRKQPSNILDFNLGAPQDS